MAIRERVLTGIRTHRPWFLTAIALVCAVSWSTVGTAAWFAYDVVTGLPDHDELRGIGSMSRATTLLDIDDRPAFTIFKEHRVEIPLEKVSPHVIKAVLAVEDQRFYEHGGVDVVRSLGAAVTNVREGRVAQGGSTITQQLARQSFLTTEKTWRRKVKEIVVAARLEREFTKDRILELYLNKVYFGDGLYGIEAAAMGYFGKHAADLDVAEAALIVGLAKSPSTYAPTVDMERATTRRDVVIEAMREMDAIDEQTARAAATAPVVLKDRLRTPDPFGHYFKEEVRKELVQRFGWERVYQGGLKVYTTLDVNMQRAAEEQVRRTLAEIEQRQGRRWRGDKENPLQAALVAMDPRTGEIRALVGGRDFETSPFNRATQAKRQAGSTFKPFVYAAALERGYSPATVITGLDQSLTSYDVAWAPEDEHSSGASMTVRAALRTSSNRAAVRVLDEIGIPATVLYARRLGIGALPNVPSLALGSGEVTLLSMTAAFASFANSGMLPMPTLIRRVETSEGELLHVTDAPQQRAVSEATAFLMTSMLADVVNAGTGWQARRVGFTLPAAGKTGTTNDYRDAWFVGFTPHLATGVWVGYDKPRTIVGEGYASGLAVPLWGRFMASATRKHEPVWFQPPPTIATATICRLSGKLATPSCGAVTSYDAAGYLTSQSLVYTEYFIRGTEPLDHCPYHSGFRVDDGVFGSVASAFGRDDFDHRGHSHGDVTVATGGDDDVAIPIRAPIPLPPAPSVPPRVDPPARLPASVQPPPGAREPTAPPPPAAPAPAPAPPPADAPPPVDERPPVVTGGTLPN